MGIFSIIGLLIVLPTAAYWLCPERWLGHKMRSVYVTLVACCIYWAAFMVVHAACGGFSHTLSGVTVWMAVGFLPWMLLAHAMPFARHTDGQSTEANTLVRHIVFFAAGTAAAALILLAVATLLVMHTQM